MRTCSQNGSRRWRAWLGASRSGFRVQGSLFSKLLCLLYTQCAALHNQDATAACNGLQLHTTQFQRHALGDCAVSHGSPIPAVLALHASCQSAHATVFVKLACLMHVATTAILHMQTVRQVLRDHLEKINPDKDWSFITSQIGMFSFTGLTPPQVSVSSCSAFMGNRKQHLQPNSCPPLLRTHDHEPATVPVPVNSHRPDHGLFMHL